MPQTLGEYLRQARNRANPKITQKQIAEQVTVSPQSVSLWEKDELTPPLKKIELVARAYQVPVGELQRFYDDSSSFPEYQGEGVGYICQVLDYYANDAAQNPDHRWVIHSLSNRDFMSADRPLIAQAVCRCAAAGVHIAYFTLPGQTDPDQVKQHLSRLKLVRDSSAILEKDRKTVTDCLWFIRPKQKELSKPSKDPEPILSGLTGEVLGIFTRIIAVLVLSSDYGDVTAEHILRPDYVDRFWIDLDMVNPKTFDTTAKWILIPQAGDLGLRYQAVLENHYRMLEAVPLLPGIEKR